MMKNSPFRAITIELVENMLKGGLNSFKGTDNTCGLVSKALKSHIKAILGSVDDIVLSQLLVLTHIYQTICLDK
jgi:hypothetical protein